MATNPNVIPWEVDHQLGMGVNSFTQRPALVNAVEITSEGNIEDPSSQEVQYSHSQTVTESQMAKALNISAALAINSGGVAGTGIGTFINKDSFIAHYGDTFISEIIEGGEFVAVISIKAKETSNIMKIAAELSVQLSMVSGKGKVDYDAAAWQSLSSTTITVKTSGGVGVNPEGKTWDISLLLKEASDFPNKVQKAKSPVKSVLRRYDTLMDVQMLKLGIGTLLYSSAAQLAASMLDERQQLDELRSKIKKLLERLVSGDLEEIQLLVSTIEGAYPASKQGLLIATDDIEQSISIIDSNTGLLAENPELKFDAESPNSKQTLTKYKTASTIRYKLPYDRNQAAAGAAIVCTSLAVIGFQQKPAGYNMRVFWQSPDRSIVQASYSENAGWAATLEIVVPVAAANTPIAACCAPDGSEQRVFYVTSSGLLADSIKHTGDKKFQDGLLSSAIIAKEIFRSTQISALRYPNGAVRLFNQRYWDGRLVIAMLDPVTKEWKIPTNPADPILQVEMLRGGSLATCITKTDMDSSKDTFSVFYQDKADSVLKEFRFETLPNGKIKKLNDVGIKVIANPLLIGAGVSAFLDSATATVVALTNTNTIVSVAQMDKDNPEKGWGHPKTIEEGIRSSGLAAIQWPKDPHPEKRVFFQQQSGPSVREAHWNASNDEWEHSAIPARF
ncbi:hypothetical protein FDECE_4498 [Fusarium decemcellulare]|nr:hypothetical protein FDECE_4498 [Fusarium decemcellulare]